ncbi:ComEC/Rec2 family competence protein [Helicobacter muridarum]|nr:ComEC/Rec2 family competence protein [Helicobacter muridarum]
MATLLIKAWELIQNIYYLNTRHSKAIYFDIKIPIRHYICLILFLLIILCINLYNKYQIFQELKDGRTFEARIINHYSKPKSKSKIKTSSETFRFQDNFGNTYYGIYRGKFKNLKGMKAIVYGKIYNCSFWQFLKSCKIYHSSFNILPEKQIKSSLTKFIQSQHKNPLIANLYNTLFFAETLDSSVRQAAIALGISHLIAISGLHLSALLGIFLLFITPIYFCLHRYFCYRNAMYDLGLLGLIFSFIYLWLIDFQPSFLRAFIMFCIGFFMMFNGIKILNMMNLFLCVILAIALNPNLIFNIGFILSISGVFYIFLFIKYFIKSQRYSTTKSLDNSNKELNSLKLLKLFFKLILFMLIIFLQMIPITHIFFPYFSPMQLISIPLGIIFPLVFPLLIFMHITGFGDIFDFIIEQTMTHEFLLSQVTTPIWLITSYIILSLFAIYNKLAYFASLIMAISFYIYNIIIYLLKL